MKLTLLLFCTMGFLSTRAFTQPFQPHYKVIATIDVENKRLKGECILQFESTISEVKLHFWANAFRSKTTTFAKEILKYTNEFYFYKNETELGGYENVEITVNGKTISIDHTKEIIQIPLVDNGTENHEIIIHYELKLPKNIDGLGFDKHHISLQHWYPTLAYHDGKKWLPMEYISGQVMAEAFGKHSITLNYPSDYVVLNESKSMMDVHPNGFHINTTGKAPNFLVVQKDYVSSTFPKFGVDTVLSIISEKKLSDEIIKEYEQSMSRSISFLQKNIPHNPPNRFVYIENGQKKKYRPFYLLSNTLDDFFYNHYLVDSNHTALVRVLNQYYLTEYLNENKIKDIFSSTVEKNIDYYPRYIDLIEVFDYNDQTNFYLNQQDSLQLNSCCGKVIGLHIFRYLQSYLGKQNFKSGLQDYLSKQFHSEISLEGLIHHLSVYSGKDLLPLLISHTNPESRSDYVIKDIGFENDSLQLIIENLSQNPLPFMIQKGKKYDITKTWYDGFMGTKSFAFAPPSYPNNPLEIQLDPNRYLREKSRDKHYARVNNKNGIARSIIRNLPSIENKMNIYPALGYNYSDKLFLGFFIQNQLGKKAKGWDYFVMPLYSFKAKKIIGEGHIGYSIFPKSGPKNIRFEMLLKSFDKFYQKENDYTERYIKLQPSVFVYYYKNFASCKSSLQLRPVFLWEEEGTFDRHGDYTGNKTKTSTILRADYKYLKSSTLGDFSTWLASEYQSYTPLNADKKAGYLKTTLITTKDFFYRSDKKIHARFFGSVFLWNTQKSSSSFEPVFTRGSIALSHQGFNDYLYDDYYVVRENQNLFVGQQVSFLEGGGFKHATGSQHVIGMSNRYAAALNLVFDIPIRKLNVLKLFFDTGVYGTPENKNKVLYSGGLALYLGDVVRVYYPLVMSKDLANLYGQNKFSWERLSFSMNLLDITRNE